MNLFKKKSPIDDASDASLVSASLGGNRDAFGRIVTRYQRLLCSLAYSSVGDLNHSEDLAQEAFVEAWKRLDTLREPEKLKSWLCGILRFKVSHFRRKEMRQPVEGAEELDESGGYESDQARTEDVTMRQEEQALLWQALEKVPETYREPLILYYRESRSIEHVAVELDLSEDAVKQRLSRGRKLLQEKMMTFVEDALSKSRPGAVFTMGVLAAITTIAPPAKAATIGATAVNVGSWFKWASLVAVIATFSGVISSFFGLRAGLDQSRTRRERHYVVKIVALFFAYAIIFVGGMFALRQLALNNEAFFRHYAVASQLLVVGFVASYMILVIRMSKGQRKLRAEERERHPEAFLDESDQVGSKAREYKSRLKLFGFPLVHMQFGKPEVGDKPAVGWIAGGETAYGLLFAWGGVAVAPISVGIVSAGLFTIGALGLGVFGMGTVGIGVIAFGASTIGYKAYGSLSALGWESAFSNGFAIAKDGAIGAIPLAEHVNNEQAVEIVNLTALGDYYLWALGVMALLVIVPAAWHSNQVRRRMRRKSGTTRN